jgi:hypothetical protein
MRSVQCNFYLTIIHSICNGTHCLTDKRVAARLDDVEERIDTAAAAARESELRADAQVGARLQSAAAAAGKAAAVGSECSSCDVHLCSLHSTHANLTLDQYDANLIFVFTYRTRLARRRSVTNTCRYVVQRHVT